MGTGDAPDLQKRLRRYLPPWFGQRGESPVVGAALAGVSAVLANVFSLITFTRQQSRIATSTGGWLDLTALSFLNGALPRFRREDDDPYRDRLRREIFRDRNTRPAGIQLVKELTGHAPFVFEGWYAPVNGGWGTPRLAWGAAGRLGSRGAPAQVIFETAIPQTYGVPSRGGWGSGATVGGWKAGNWSWVNYIDSVGHNASLTDILNRLESIRTDGVEYWVHFGEPAGF